MMEAKQKTNFVEGVLYTSIGSNIEPIYERVFNKETGKSLVVKTGEFDIDEYIQASNCKTDLAMLRQEMLATGQLPVVGDEVVDATLFPENIHEVYDAVNQVDNVFNTLPDSVKALFKNKDDFMSSLIKGDYQQRVVNGLSALQNEGQNLQEEEKKEGNK